MSSIWKNTAELPKFSPLKGDIKTDVLIIGGGLAGVLCAYRLAQAGVDYVLVEADQICHGVTGNTTAKITVQHGLIYAKLLQMFGAERAKMYLEANQKALEEYRRLSQTIPCSFEERDSYVYTTGQTNQLAKELAALAQIGASGEYVKTLSLPLSITGAVKFKHQAQFHPLEFIAGIVPGLNIHEHTAVREYDGRTFVTEHGRITAEKTIAATHFPFLNKHGSYFLKLYQHRSYVLALQSAPEVNGMYVDEDKTGLSFRNHKDLLLLGGGSHRTGKRGGAWKELSAFAKTHYPKAREAARWATQDCMTLDGVPYIGQYSKETPQLYVATGFNKWGVTSAMAAAMMLADMVAGKDNPYTAVFSPSRSILRPQLALNALETTVNLLTPTKPRCPHLGCALKWNSQEHSWDCPCHGSRFSPEGTLLDTPATGDLK